MQRSKNDVWVGLFVMLGVVAVVFLALQAANLLTLNFQSGYRVTARFDSIFIRYLTKPKKSFSFWAR